MIEIVFVYFRTTTLQHLDNAWYSLSQQDFTDVTAVQFLDNNTPDDPTAIAEVLHRYPIPVPVTLHHAKHGDPTRTHAWSVNEACRLVSAPLMFFTRSDYILAFDCLHKFREGFAQNGPEWRGFVTSWCYQMGCDDSLSNTDVYIDLNAKYPTWRDVGPAIFDGQEPAARFKHSGEDAGVWMTNPARIIELGGANEKLIAWGFQQSALQRSLRYKLGVEMTMLHDWLFYHQHHAAPRDVDQAMLEYSNYGQGV